MFCRRSLVRWLGLLLACIAAAVPAFHVGQCAQQSHVDLETLQAQAESAQEKGDYRQARDLYAKMLAQEPDLLELRMNVGLMDHLIGDYADAVRQLRFVAQRKPELFAASFMLGVDLNKLHRYAEALPPLRNADHLNSKSALVNVAIAQAYAGLQDFEAANDWYAQGVDVDPTNADAWYGLGVTYLSIERVCFDKMARLEPSPNLRRQIFASLASVPDPTRRDFLNAKMDFEQQPTRAAAVARVVDLAGRLGISVLSRVASAEPDSERMTILFAQAMEIGKKWDEAEAALQRLLVDDPGNWHAALVLASIYWRTSRFDKISPYIRVVLDRNPNDPEACFIMGDVLSVKGSYEEAKPYLVKATKSSTAIVPHAYGLLGKVYAEEGRVSDAIDALERALPVDRDGRYRYQLSRLYVQLGDNQSAAKWLRESEEVRAANHRKEQETLEGH